MLFLKKHSLKFALNTLFLILITSKLHAAYFAVHETGEIIPAGTYRVGVDPQLVSGAGFNLGGHFDSALSESTSFRAFMGGGDTDFYAGLLYKIIPFPDVDNQPAMGLRTGVVYGRHDSDGALSLKAEPLLSKKVDTDYGLFTPYVAIPFGFSFVKSKTINPMHVAIGSEYKSLEYENLYFGCEIGIDMNDSLSYISGYLSFSLDDEKGLKF